MVMTKRHAEMNFLLNIILFVQVLPLVPPGRKGNEEGSPYSGQVSDMLSLYCFVIVFPFLFFFCGRRWLLRNLNVLCNKSNFN